MQDIILAVCKGENTPQRIANATSKQRPNVHETLRRLISKGLIEQEEGTGHYKLTAAGNHFVHDIVTEQVITKTSKRVQPRNKRGHNMRAKFAILRAPAGWRESPKAFFNMQTVDWEPLGLKNVNGVQFTLDDVFIKATSKHIVMIPKNPIYYDSAADLMRIFIPLVLGMKKRLQRQFSQLKLSDIPIITVGEIAHERDLVAELRQHEGFRVIQHSDGRTRVQFDRSKGWVEIEFVHPGMFDEDSDTWDRRIIQLLDSPYDYDMMAMKVEKTEADTQEIRGILLEMSRGQLQAQQQINYYAENIARHVSIMENIGGAITRIDKTLTQQTGILSEIQTILPAFKSSSEKASGTGGDQVTLTTYFEDVPYGIPNAKRGVK